jgi:hypothetical protein
VNVSINIEDDLRIQQPVCDVLELLVALRRGSKRGRAIITVVLDLDEHCQSMFSLTASREAYIVQDLVVELSI